MPIEIKELHIKAIINDSSEGNNNDQDISSSNSGNEQVIKACVERVMELIKEAKER